MPTENRPTTIVLIPGLWLTALSWEHWIDRFESKGFRVVAENWPGMDGDIQALRNDHAAFDDVGLDDGLGHSHDRGNDARRTGQRDGTHGGGTGHDGH